MGGVRQERRTGDKLEVLGSRGAEREDAWHILRHGHLGEALACAVCRDVARVRARELI